MSIATKAWNSGKTCFDDIRILSGERHPRWKNKSKYYIKFKLLTHEMRENKTKCSQCPKLAKLYHHIDKNTDNNSIKNLLPLCKSCHTILHNKERGITIYKHNCEWCGNEFIVLSRRNCKQRCCSLFCKSKLSYKENKILLKNKLGRKTYSHICQLCNIKFKSTNPKRMYCSNNCKLNYLHNVILRKS
jgi:hypothetical protein